VIISHYLAEAVLAEVRDGDRVIVTGRIVAGPNGLELTASDLGVSLHDA
jgi:hypothetical protein